MKKVTASIIYLICWFLTFNVSAKDLISEPSINYRIHGDFPTLPLPQPKWIIREGQMSLTVEDLKSGNLKDAEVIQTDLRKIILCETEVTFWIHLRITSDIAVNKWKMVADRQAPENA